MAIVASPRANHRLENDDLSRSELSRRPDLWDEPSRVGGLSRDDRYRAATTVTRDGVDRRVAAVVRGGVEITADDFESRWDLDGDGKVEQGELPAVPSLLFRGIVAKERR